MMKFQEDGDSSDHISVFICYSKPVMLPYVLVFCSSWNFHYYFSQVNSKILLSVIIREQVVLCYGLNTRS